MDPGGGIQGSPNIVTPNDEIDGDVTMQRTMLVAKSYAGEFPFKGDGENMFEPLLAIFGKDVQTQVAGAGSTTITPVYKHVYTPSSPGYFPSFTFEEIFGDANYARLTSGVITEELSLDFNSILQCRERVAGYRQTPNKYGDLQYDFGSATANLIPTEMGGNATKCFERTATPTFVDVAQLNNGNGPFVWGGMGFGNESGFSAAFVKVDGSAKTVNILPGIKINIKRMIESFLVGGSGYDPGACVGNALEITGSMDILFQDNTIPLAALSNSRIELNFVFDGIYIGSSAVKYRIEVYIPHAKFLRNPVVMPNGAIHVGGEFACKKDATSGWPIKISLTNAFSNANLVGLAGSSGNQGGGGGWLNA